MQVIATLTATGGHGGINEVANAGVGQPKQLDK